MSFIISGSNDFDEDPDLSVVKMTVTLNNGKTYSCSKDHESHQKNN